MSLPNINGFGIVDNPLVDSVFANDKSKGGSQPPSSSDFLLLDGSNFLLLDGSNLLLL